MTDHVVFEQKLQNLYQKILNPGDVAIDIGAHSGRHTLPMLLAVNGKDSGAVIAFEPIPECREWILHRFAVEKIPTKNLKIYSCALSDCPGESEFLVAVDRPEESGLVARKYNGPTDVKRIRVEIKILDDVVKRGPISFIKIDCEGAEYRVLKGGSDVIKKFEPVVAFEFGRSSYSVYGINPVDMYYFFEAMGYFIYSIQGIKMNLHQFLISAEEEKIWDYIAFPTAKWSESKINEVFNMNQDN